MKIIRFKTNFTLLLFFVTVFFSTAQAKNLEKFDDGENISNYFSGLLQLSENNYDLSYKNFKKLEGLEDEYPKYSKKFIYSLINLGRFNEAFKYSKKLEKKGMNSFVSDLIIGIHYLKNKNYILSEKYFAKLNKKENSFVLTSFISESLLNWSSFKRLNLISATNKIDSVEDKFSNLKKIQSAFLHCFYQSNQTDVYFKKLTDDKKTDFSRYNYFYAIYLTNSKRIEEAKKIINYSLEKHPRNILLKQFKIDLQNKKFLQTLNFDCKNVSHVIAEILYISANALSSQSFYSISNFYLNLAKYLNPEFIAFETLLAENFFRIENYNKAKRVYNKIEKVGSAYYWYSTKQKAKILKKLNEDDKAVKLMMENFEKLKDKSIYEKFDYAEFLKNNKKYEKSVGYYSEVLKSVNINHPIYAEATDGRGVSFERLGKWAEAEKDLKESLRADPNQAYVINYLAYSWIEKGINIEKSLGMLKKANELKSDDPYIIDSLGWALYKLKKYQEAKKYLQMAVQLLPADPVINDHFGDVLWMNNKKLQARYYWNYVLKLDETEDELKDSIIIKLSSGI